eukprot:CAMPEP_0206248290 /NCGR_PEP_ID=MMETSP0047_2-20121206/20290_1 /ASSEMBLY_ACC=CAM_ASM_000192 /TAXON_ID=195065 /ORGANISM="Chroomonas mesostigmatica_cf, Strain CCMP1168" /LENGTH=203 /DNA_ID=CAMNT_0053673923 /DNA_START=298 /DNA_END=908 /DNA_ORIENTATION=-
MRPPEAELLEDTPCLLLGNVNNLKNHIVQIAEKAHHKERELPYSLPLGCHLELSRPHLGWVGPEGVVNERFDVVCEEGEVEEEQPEGEVEPEDHGHEPRVHAHLDREEAVDALRVVDWVQVVFFQLRVLEDPVRHHAEEGAIADEEEDGPEGEGRPQNHQRDRQYPARVILGGGGAAGSRRGKKTRLEAACGVVLLGAGGWAE